MARNRPNPEYRDARLEICIWTVSTGCYVMREVRRKGNTIYLRGEDEIGQIHYEIYTSPAFDGNHWIGGTEVHWK